MAQIFLRMRQSQILSVGRLPPLYENIPGSVFEAWFWSLTAAC